MRCAFVLACIAYAVAFLPSCASLGKAPADPAAVAAKAHQVSVDACRAYHAAVALGAPSDPRADAACAAAQGLCE
jgi:outer membrane biogenesis lipoprotein LolB